MSRPNTEHGFRTSNSEQFDSKSRFSLVPIISDLNDQIWMPTKCFKRKGSFDRLFRPRSRSSTKKMVRENFRAKMFLEDLNLDHPLNCPQHTGSYLTHNLNTTKVLLHVRKVLLHVRARYNSMTHHSRNTVLIFLFCAKQINCDQD